MGARFPVMIEDGKPIVRRIREEFQVGKRRPADAETARLNYPAASTDKSKARLTVRGARIRSARRGPGRSAGSSPMRARSGCCPKGTKFSPLTIYELWYEATDAKVVGIGFAATRDLVSFLRNERADDKGTANPLAGGHGIRHTMAFGGSQSGRYPAPLHRARHEQGRARAARLRRRATRTPPVPARCSPITPSPSRTAPPPSTRTISIPENWFPFSTATTTDPFSGKTGLAVARRRQRSADDRDQHLDRVLAEGRVAAHHGSDRHA